MNATARATHESALLSAVRRQIDAFEERWEKKWRQEPFFDPVFDEIRRYFNDFPLKGNKKRRTSFASFLWYFGCFRQGLSMKRSFLG